MRKTLTLLWILLALPVFAGPVIISEFLAVNTAGEQDGDGDFSDWIELVHLGPGVIDLEGWHLTDTETNLTRWTFPGVSLQAGERLLVYASGKNRAVSGAELHTDFSLAREGEFLALVEPDGTTIAHQYAPYPEQVANVSYGIGLGPAGINTPLLEPGDDARLLIPDAPVPSAWQGGAAFDDSTWSNITLGAGFNLDPGPVIDDRVETVAYEIAAGTTGNQSFGGALGMDFIVNEPIIVSALGVFDDLSDGLNRTITAELWSRDDGGTVEDPNDDAGGVILASQVFSDAVPGQLLGGSRFMPLAAPLELQPGAYTIVAHGYGVGERNGNTTGGGDFGPLDGAGGTIGFVGAGRFGVTPGQFPGSVDGGPEGRYGAGTFRFFRAGDPRIQTDLEGAWHNANAAALFRMPFAVTDPGLLVDLDLEIAFDDGYAAYLNGALVASNNAPAGLQWDSSALLATALVEAVELDTRIPLLQVGTNLLAIQVLNVATDDRDALLDISLHAQLRTEERVYFAQPTPGLENAFGTYGTGLVINELYIDPDAGMDLEFVELYNASDAPVDLAGMQLTDGLTYTFPSGVVVAAGGFAVVAADPAAFSNAFPGVVAWGPFAGQLNNAGERVTLEDAGSNRVNRVNYGVGAPWPVTGDAPHHSIQLVHPGLDNDLAGSWRAAAPTPGAVNSVLTIHPPPQVRQVDHAPAMPRSGEPVVVSCKVSDPDGVAEVELLYQLVEPGSYIRSSDAGYATNWTALTMAPLGEGVYEATLPGTLQVHRRLVRYRIHALDTGGNDAWLPLPSDPSLNFAYFVYDGAPAWTAADIPGQTPPVTFSTNVMNALSITHLVAQEADVINAQYNRAFNDKVYRFEGALVQHGRVYDHIRYRVRGAGSTYNTGKNKWKLRFNRGNFLRVRDDYGRPRREPVRTLNWSALASPWNPANRGAAGLDEVLAMRLWQRAGVSASNTSYFHLRVIDAAAEQDLGNQFEGDNWGLYASIEQADRRFLDERDLPDGNVFNNHFGSSNYLNQGRDQPDDRSDLFTFTGTGAEGYNRDPVQPQSWWEDNVDLDGYFSYRAVIEAVNHSDLRDRENSIYYHNPVSGKWSVIPWDSDLLYEEFDRWGPNGVQSAATLEQFRKCLTHEDLNIRFQNRARELQDLLLNNDQGWTMVDEIAQQLANIDGGLGWPEVDRARWDRDPRSRSIEGPSTSTGSFYLNPYTSTRFPPLGRTLVSADFSGMTNWVKNFIVPTGFGGGRLDAMIEDVDIPQRPAISYTGDTGFPTSGLRFDSTAFGAGNAGAGFQAVEWRLGRVRNPSTPDYVPGEPWQYEVDSYWSSGVQTTFVGTIALPAQEVEVGASYRARVRHQGVDGRWSHWSDALAFTATAPNIQAYRDGLVVSELMYHPLGSEDLEFIELCNVGAVPLDLAPLQFTAGITFDFSSTAVSTLATGAYVLVVRNLAAFEAHYGTGLPVAGEYRLAASDSLSNGGEQVVLAYGADVPLRDFTYDNRSPWPEEADGQGYSLTLMTPQDLPDHNLAASWRGSVAIDGSPGTSDAVPFVGTPDADDNANGIPDLLDYLLLDAPEGQWTAGGFVYSFSERVGADDAYLEVQVSYDLATWTNAPPALLALPRERVLDTAVHRYQTDTQQPYAAFRLRATLR